jgi:predicted MFS family arabinose efflux permease
VLIKAIGAPVTMLVDACLLLVSALVLRGIRVVEAPPPSARHHFWRDLKEGIAFVRGHRLLLALARAVGVWQFCYNAAVVVQILHATRSLGLSERGVGLCYVGMGLSTLLASVVGQRISVRFGSGPTLVIGFACCALGWLTAGLLARGAWGIAAYAAMLAMLGFGAVLMFINFLALRQAVTPAPLLGRMTSTMRWLILIPAGPGALFGGWLGERAGLSVTLVFAGLAGLLLATLAWRSEVIRNVRRLPQPETATT